MHGSNMKKFLRGVLVVGLISGGTLHAQAKADEAAVRAIPQAFAAAWAKHDGHELAKIMADDVDFVNVGGDWLHGKHDFELYHSRLLSGPFKNSTLTAVDTVVRFTRPDMAVLHWSWSIVGDGHSDPVTHTARRGIFTMIVEKRGGVWLVTIAQNTNQSIGPNPLLEGIETPITYPSILD